MAQITLNIKGDFDKFGKQVVNDAKQMGLNAAHEIMTDAVQSGRFTDDASKVQLFLVNRGREHRRKFSTIKPQFLRFPFRLRWMDTSAGIGEMVAAARFAFEQVQRRAPYKTGAYERSITVYLNQTPTTLSAIAAREDSLEQTDRIQVGPAIIYGFTLEKGFYTQYYKTQQIPGGIVRPVAKIVRQKFGSDVACAFKYYAVNVGNRATAAPMLEIGPPGSFPQNDARPGRVTRRTRWGR